MEFSSEKLTNLTGEQWVNYLAVCIAESFMLKPSEEDINYYENQLTHLLNNRVSNMSL